MKNSNEPVCVEMWKCPICGFTHEDKGEVLYHMNNSPSIPDPLDINTPVIIRNRHGGFSVARVIEWEMSESHIRVYDLDREVFYKDSDHYGTYRYGHVVWESDLLTKEQVAEMKLVLDQQSIVPHTDLVSSTGEFLW